MPIKFKFEQLYPIKYRGKVELIKYSLKLYSIFYIPLTKRDTDVLTLAFQGDLNSPEFKEDLMDAVEGMNTIENVYTCLSRLRGKGVIEKHPVKKGDYLNKELQLLKELVMNRDDIGFQLMFSDKVGRDPEEDRKSRRGKNG